MRYRSELLQLIRDRLPATIDRYRYELINQALIGIGTDVGFPPPGNVLTDEYIIQLYWYIFTNFDELK